MSWGRQVRVSDEIVHEIVSYLPGAEFWFPDVPAPRAFHAPNPRNYHHLHSALLVNRQWNRVVEPFLYENVVLIGEYHTWFLYRTLLRPGTKKAHLGKVIKKLRIEADYNVRRLGGILQLVPNVQELYIEFPAWTHHDLGCLLKGFESINPRRLALYDSSWPSRTSKRRLFREISKCFSLWNNMTEILLDLHCHSVSTNEYMCRILSQARHLRKVVIAAHKHHNAIPISELLVLRTSQYIEKIQVVIEPWTELEETWPFRYIENELKLQGRIEYINPVDGLWKV